MDLKVLGLVKGKISTFWMTVPGLSETDTYYGSKPTAPPFEEMHKESKEQRLVEWNTQALLSHLRKVVARRNVVKGKKFALVDVKVEKAPDGQTCLDEASHVISMTKFDPKIAAKEADPATIDLGEAVATQLRSYVETTARMYNKNPFHNFVHASHGK